MDSSHSEQAPEAHFSLASDTLEQQQTLSVPYGSEALQFGELRLPNQRGPYPVAILIHGGFWRNPYGLDLMKPLAEDLLARGFATWNIEYRRIGDEGGGWPGTLQDVSNATEALKVLAPSYALDINRVVTIGHSAGGHLALWLAARHRIPEDILQETFNTQPDTLLQIAGAISLAGVVDLPLAWQLNLSNGAVAELLGGSPAEVPERYQLASPTSLVPLGVPQVLVHGTEDSSVPLQVSQEYARVAREAGDPVYLIELPGVDHFAPIDPTSDAWNQTFKALQGLLGIV